MNQFNKIYWHQFFYPSNIFSLLRVPLAVGFVYYLQPFNLNGVIIFALLALFTDWADGFFARQLNQVTKLGIILDPLADKIALAIAVIGLVFAGYIELWLAAVIVGRDAIILSAVVALKLKYPRLAWPSSNITGKISVNFIAGGVLLQLTRIEYLAVLGMICIGVAVIMSLVSYCNFISDELLALEYDKKLNKTLNEKSAD